MCVCVVLEYGHGYLCCDSSDCNENPRAEIRPSFIYKFYNPLISGMPLVSSISVSYTHLDVYKRQLGDFTLQATEASRPAYNLIELSH